MNVPLTTTLDIFKDLSVVDLRVFLTSLEITVVYVRLFHFVITTLGLALLLLLVPALLKNGSGAYTNTFNI